MKRLFKRFLEWVLLPEKGQLSDLEIMQAENLAMVNAIEMLANLIIKSNGLMTKDLMAAQFRAHANHVLEIAHDKMDVFERLSLQVTATQLDDIATNIIGASDNENDQNQG